MVNIYVEMIILKLKNSFYMIMLGIGGTLLYQQIKNGNFRKMVREMNRTKTKIVEDLEDMM